ncbi:MAG TPA: 2-dehydropantoate 2-reductase [Lapillicoccus sp.]|nr:2-dehydropantoate 2-reductase [Lapillicoccus sp.]
MKVVVIGAGGVGGYFGGRLATAGHEVSMVARGPHLAALSEQGLRVRSVKGDFSFDVPVAEDASVFGPCDVVLFCVKAFDTESAAGGLAPVMGPDTAVVSLQNGVDNEDQLAAALGAEHVVGGAAFIFSTITEPGVVTHTGGPARIVFGERDNRRSDRVERLLAACREAGIGADIAPDIGAVLWTKFAFICATAGMTASVRLALGDIRETPPAWAMFRDIITEVVQLARLEGVALAEDVVEQQIHFATGLAADSYSSLYHDLTTGRRMELDALHGSVVRRAERLGLDVPACRAVHATLAPWARRNAAG